MEQRNSVDSTETPVSSQNQAEGADSTQAAADRARMNQGNNVRSTWRFSLDSVREKIEYMSPEAKELLVWSFTWCIDPAHAIDFAEFCERLGYDENTIYKAYTGRLMTPQKKGEAHKAKPMDLSAGMIQALRNFRRTELSRAKLGKNKFVMTPTAKRVFLACDLARESQTPVFLEGASHIGKTEAARQYCIENNHGRTILIELEGLNGLGGVIRALCDKLGISPEGNAVGLMIRIKRAVTRDMCLIFDELHLLANTMKRTAFFKCVEFIRRLYDHCQCGVVLMFTKLGFDSVEKERKRELEQIFRRGVHRVNLGDRPTVKDVKAVVESWNLEFPARNETVEIEVGNTTFSECPYAMLAQLSVEHGLKSIVERLRYATKFAADAEEPLDWEHVVRAHYTVTRNAQSPEHGWAA